MVAAGRLYHQTFGSNYYVVRCKQVVAFGKGSSKPQAAARKWWQEAKGNNKYLVPASKQYQKVNSAKREQHQQICSSSKRR